MHYVKTREDYLHLHPWGVSCLREPPSAYGSRYMDLREDFVFKHIFGKESNKSLLIDLVNSLSEGRRQICDLCYGSVERQGAMKGTRKTVFDIQCTSDRGEQFLIEMQREREEGFFRRLLHYAMRLGIL